MDIEKRNIFVLYALVVILAVGLRFWRLTEVLDTLWVDEAWFGIAGEKVISGQDLLPLEPTHELGVGESAFQIYASGTMQLLGVSQSFASRHVSAVMGSLGVILTFPVLIYLLAFTSFAPQRYWIALIATFIMATLSTGLVHSRHGMQMAGSVVFTLLFFYGLAHVYQTGRWQWMVLTGISIGIGLTTYEAFLAVPLYLFAYTAVRLIQPVNLTRRQILLSTGLIVLVALMVWSPLIVFYYYNPGIYFSHGAQTQAYDLKGSSSLLESGWRIAQVGLEGIIKVWGGLSFLGDAKPGRNIPFRPLFDPFVAFFFWLGLIWTAWRQWRHPVIQMMLLWFFIFSLPSAMSNEAPAFSRMLPMTPVLAGFVGLGVMQLITAVRTQSPTAQHVLVGIILVGLFISGGWSTYSYFGRWAVDPQLFDVFRMGDRPSLENALTLEAQGKDVFVTTESNAFLKYPMQALLHDHNSQIVAFDAQPSCLPYPNEQLRDTVFAFIGVLGDKVRPALEEAYPAGYTLTDMRVRHAVFGSSHGRFFEIPAGVPAPAPQHTVAADFAEGIRLSGYDVQRKPGLLKMALHWEGSGPVAPAVSYFVHVGQGDNSDPMIGQIDGELCSGFLPWRWQAGYRYIQYITVPLPDEIPQGDFDIRVGLYDTYSQQRLPILLADRPVENQRLWLQALP